MSLNPSTARELTFYFAVYTDMIFSLNKPCYLFSKKILIFHYNIMDLVTDFLYTFNNRLVPNMARWYNLGQAWRHSLYRLLLSDKGI